MSAPKRTPIIEGNLHSLDPSALRKAQDVLRNALAPDIRISPVYPRDKNRAGYIFFITIFKESKDFTQQRLGEG